MLFRNQDAIIRRNCNIKSIIFLPLMIAIVVVISACSASKGSILILEDGQGTGFTMELKRFNTESKCELSIAAGDVLQVEVDHENGEIALIVCGKRGSEPYTGNNLQSGIFTFAVSEVDDYVFRVTGKDATGKITVKNLGGEAK